MFAMWKMGLSLNYSIEHWKLYGNIAPYQLMNTALWVFLWILLFWVFVKSEGVKIEAWKFLLILSLVIVCVMILLIVF